MKLITLAFLFLALSLRAESIQGDIKLDYSDSSFSDKTFKKEFGSKVKATTSWYAGEFFGEETVFASINVKNTATKPMFFNYYVAFFDKDKKLVGATGQGSFGQDGLKPGEESQMGSCLVKLPKDKYKEIVSYQAVIYETDIAPKK
ncbi:MAG: hypothetical protein JWM68_4071 [Verrucomicrobiales bacterium]|nr:hypothetical protein [Verrucomicrobiales bacterium]